jgi:dihydroorotate dehydrogenase (fumarate)
MRAELLEWLASHELNDLDELRGSLSQLRCPNPEAFERAQYLRALSSYSTPWLHPST